MTIKENKKKTQTELNISELEQDNQETEKTENQKPMTKLTGITTSQINQALKADNPYPARVFLKVENQEQDIPIFFRIKTPCQFHSRCQYSDNYPGSLTNCRYTS
jgi:hypothetical protein